MMMLEGSIFSLSLLRERAGTHERAGARGTHVRAELPSCPVRAHPRARRQHRPHQTKPKQTKLKRSEAKQNKTKRSATQRNATTKRNKTKQNETKVNNTKRRLGPDQARRSCGGCATCDQKGSDVNEKKQSSERGNERTDGRTNDGTKEHERANERRRTSER